MESTTGSKLFAKIITLQIILAVWNKIELLPFVLSRYAF